MMATHWITALMYIEILNPTRSQIGSNAMVPINLPPKTTDVC